RLTEMVNAGRIDEAVEHFVDAISGPGTYRARSDAANQMTRDNIRTALGETRDTREPVTRERAATLKLPCLLIGGGKSPPRPPACRAGARGAGTAAPRPPPHRHPRRRPHHVPDPRRRVQRRAAQIHGGALRAIIARSPKGDEAIQEAMRALSWFASLRSQ